MYIPYDLALAMAYLPLSGVECTLGFCKRCKHILQSVMWKYHAKEPHVCILNYAFHTQISRII